MNQGTTTAVAHTPHRRSMRVQRPPTTAGRSQQPPHRAVNYNSSSNYTNYDDNSDDIDMLDSADNAAAGAGARAVAAGSRTAGATAAADGFDGAAAIFDYLEPNLKELVTAASTLHANLTAIDALYRQYTDLNRYLGSFVQGLVVSSDGISFPHGPVPESFEAAGARAEAAANAAAKAKAEAARVEQERRAAEAEAAAQAARELEEQQRRHAAEQAAMMRGPRQPQRGGSAGSRLAGGRQQQQQQQQQRPGRGGPSAKPSVPAPLTGLSLGRIVDSLPTKFREQPGREMVETIVKALRLAAHGAYLHELTGDTGLAKNKVIECLGALEKRGHVVKTSNKGFLFALDPAKYPPF